MKTPEQRCKSIMKRINVDRRQMAADLGISLSSVAMYYTGGHKIRKVVALAIQAVYGINHEWIMDGKRPIYIAKTGRSYSEDAMEIAALYSGLTKKMRAVAKTTLQAFSLAVRQEERKVS